MGKTHERSVSCPKGLKRSEATRSSCHRECDSLLRGELENAPAQAQQVTYLFPFHPSFRVHYTLMDRAAFSRRAGSTKNDQ